MDTGAQKTLMNLTILPSSAWKPSVHFLKATDRKIFRMDLITEHKISIKFFPRCIIWTKVIRIYLPNKDIVIGMDVYTQNHILHILSQGNKFKREFKPYYITPKLFALTDASLGYEGIKDKLLKISADSHDLFEHPRPLWKNEKLIVELPFKLNEYINPTKVVHQGMSPSDKIAAFEECQQLLKQELIEPTKSN